MGKKSIIVSGGKGYLGKTISQTLEKAGFNIINERIDLTDEIAVSRYAQKVRSEFSDIWGIIHTASAPLVRKKVLDGSIADFGAQFSVNVLGGFNLFKYFMPMVLPGGFIVGITSQSIESKTTHQNSGSYIPAKLALRGLLKVLSKELDAQRIRVYAIAPAFMPGGLNKDLPETVVDFISKKSSKEDMCSPQEVSDLIVKLAENDDGYPSGKSISVPGLKITDL